jgi:hypothetical protein
VIVAGMTSTAMTSVKVNALIALPPAIAALGIYVSDADDPSLPGLGPAGIGMLQPGAMSVRSPSTSPRRRC